MTSSSTKAALRDSEARLAGIIDSAMDGIISVDSDQKILVFNRAAERMFRTPAAEAIGQPLDRFLPERYRGAHTSHIETFGKTGVSTRAMAVTRGVFGLRAGGEEFPVEASISQVEAAGEKIFTVIMRDISERERAEERFRQIIEHSPLGKVLVDDEGKIQLANAEVERSFGYSRDELIGQPVELLVPERFHGRHAHYRDGFIAAPSARTMGAGRDLFGLRKDGTEFPVEIGLNPIEMEGGTYVVGSIVDITARKLAEREVHRLNEELEQRVLDRTEQLEAANKELESFSYSVSHDLRAPLRHIDGFVQLLNKREAKRLDETSARYLQVVSDSVRKMGQLIDELLAFSRTGRVEINTIKVDPNVLIVHAKSELASEMSGRKIEWKIAHLPAIEGDAVLLGIVFTNLLSNAIKYTRERVEAHIEIGITDETDDDVTIFIRDNGAGFDMKYADKLFGVFQRLHREEQFEGIGIGLATVQRIVLRHGGKIWPESEVSKGATFYLTLRRAKE